MKQNKLSTVIACAALIGAIVTVCVTCVAQSTASDPTKSDPIAYLNRALDVMQARSLRRDHIGWPHLRKEALARAARAEITVDTYDAIRFALASLDDHHSSFHPTPGLEDLEAKRKALRQPAREPAPQPVSSSPFTGRYEPEGRLAAFGGKTFALAVVTKCFTENDRQFIAYETKLQRIVADLDKSHPAGWIVDLRGNVGGNIWPMLAGIGPLLGEGDHLGEFFTPDSHSTWKYRDGITAEIEDGKEGPYPAIAGAPYKLVGTPKVAVLIDRRTGSAGGAIAIAFRDRPETRFFGEHTEGVSTANDVVKLSDGASMWLTIGVDADRTGKQYIEGFDPDEVIRLGDTILPDDQDPVIAGRSPVVEPRYPSISIESSPAVVIRSSVYRQRESLEQNCCRCDSHRVTVGEDPSLGSFTLHQHQHIWPKGTHVFTAERSSEPTVPSDDARRPGRDLCTGRRTSHQSGCTPRRQDLSSER
jgi:carboxyl-terminal processing protease